MQKAFINEGVSALSNIISDLGIKKIFFVVGNNAFPSIKEMIEPHIREVETELFSVTDSDPETIVSGCEKLKLCNADIVIAIGGGRIIDVAKLISTVALTSNNFESVIKGSEAITGKFLPLLVMPTTAGTGSEATSFSVVYLENKKYSVVSEYLLPDYVIADAVLVQDMPDYLKACTVFDAFCQAIESFWAVNSSVSSKKNAKKAIELINKNIHSYFKGNTENNKHMVNAAFLSGRAINESKTTLPHALSYFMTKKYGIPHGHAVALTLGFVGKINIISGDEKLKNVMLEITNMLGIDAKNFEQYWRELMEMSGLEVNLSKLGFEKNDLDLLIESVNVERLKNHPISIDKLTLMKELGGIF